MENFDSMALPDQWSLKIVREQSDTSNKPWSMIPDGYNTGMVNEIPKQVWDNYNEQDTIVILAKYPIIKAVLNSMIVNVNMGDYKKQNIPHESLIEVNKAIWRPPILNFVEHNKESRFPIKPICVKEYQPPLDEFLTEFNRKYNSHPSEKVIPDYFGKKHFDIMRYQLLGIDDCVKDSSQIFKVIAVIFRHNAIHSIYLYLELLSTGKLISWDVIGYQTTDKILTFKGKNTISNNFYETKWLYEKGSQVGNPVFTDDDFETYFNNHFYNKSNRLAHTYGCFNAEPAFMKLTNGVNQSIVYPYYNKFDCESNYNVLGQKKVRGFWDRRCLTDDECPYTGANKNYTNQRGRCVKTTGYCEIPAGMQHLGYRHYLDPEKYPEHKPLCYNCKSTDKWDPLTKLGQCCEEQKDRTKYPFLKSPDYAFEMDIHDRMQYDKKMEYEQRFRRFLADI